VQVAPRRTDLEGICGPPCVVEAGANQQLQRLPAPWQEACPLAVVRPVPLAAAQADLARASPSPEAGTPWER
jgi:hypothetical protein